MANSDKNEIFMSPAPHISSPVKTKDLMLSVVIALIPAAIYGVYIFGIPALVRIVISVLVCVAGESLFRLACNRDIRFKDFSAVITGLLIAMVIPPNLPIWMLIIGCLFGIVVGKEFFGGLGANVFNPALVGRAFMVVSFSGAMTNWVNPKISAFNAVASATPAQSAGVDAIAAVTPLKLVNINEGVILSASDIAGKLNLSSVGDVYKELFLGFHGGCIGETSILMILIGFVFLLVRKVIDWRITVSMIATTVGITAIAGIDPILTITAGGLVFGAVFMATDYVTSPVTNKGKLLFGFGCGLITALLRLFSGMPEGVMYSILIMNTTVPFLNKLIRKKYGFVKPGK